MQTTTSKQATSPSAIPTKTATWSFLNKPISDLEIAGRPIYLLFIGFVSITLGTTGMWFFGNEVAQSLRCTAATHGVLSPTYDVIQHKRKGVVTHCEYSVRYHFEVDGKTFSGKDTIGTEPLSVNTSVRYDPTDPTNNELESASMFELILCAGFLCGGIFMGFFFRDPKMKQDINAR